MSAFDAGRRSARAGQSRKSNPYDHPDFQPPGDAWERMASEWDEGFDSYDPVEEARARRVRAKQAAKARWNSPVQGMPTNLETQNQKQPLEKTP